MTNITITDSGIQTITGKTIDGDSNTLSNLDLGNEVDWAAADDVTTASAFASGDKVLIFEAGVGMRKIDYDDLPSVASSSLDAAYNGGNTIDVDGDPVTMTVSDTDNNVALVLNQNDTTNNPNTLEINSASSGTPLRIISTAGLGSPTGIVIHDDVSGFAGNESSSISFNADNASATEVTYTKIRSFINSDTAASESASLELQAIQSGSLVTLLEVGAENGSEINGISVGLTTAAGVISSRGNQDLTLQTGNATTGSITITDGANGNITLLPNGTGNVLLGNLTFDADQTVGAGQDNYVLTYDNAAGVISLEAPADGSSYITENADGFEITAGTTPRTLTVVGGDVTLTGGATTKGDILASDGTKLTLVSVGTNNQYMVADSAQSSGVKWSSLDISHDTTPTLGGDLTGADKNVTGLGRVSFTQELDNGSKTTSFSVDFSTDQKQKVTLTANTMTLTLDTTSIGVGSYLLKIVNGGLATLTWAAETGSVLWPGGTAPTLTSSGTDLVSIYFDGTNFYCSSTLNFS